MSKTNNPTLNADAVKALRELQKKKDSGEAIDPESEKALSALSLASRIMNSISNGHQVDPAFLKAMILEMEKGNVSPQPNARKIIKKKKLKVKRKSDIT